MISTKKQSAIFQRHYHFAARCLMIVALLAPFPSTALAQVPWWQPWKYLSSEANKSDEVSTRIDQPHPVKELAYGELLFDYYQQNYMTSITKILVQRDRQKFEHHQSHIDLLQGSLYVSFGLVDEAETIFKILIKNSVDLATQNAAWLNLAEINFIQGRYENAKNILLNNLLEPNIEIQNKQYDILSQIALNEKDYALAIQYLSQIEEDNIKQRYASYNLAIAKLNTNQPQLAIEHLQDLIKKGVKNREQDALRDKAAIALGHYYLHHQEPYLATTAFKKVRLHGPFADQAMLGLGWGNLLRSRNTQALAPWLSLTEMDASSPTVQQALLMVPRTYESLQAYQDALDSYRKARQTYMNEIVRIEHTLNYVKNNDWLHQLRPTEKELMQHLSPLDYQENDIPLQGPEAKHLFRLFAAEDFDRGFQQYWQLELFHDQLKQWQSQIPIYRSMLDNHKIRHDTLMPEVEKQLAAVKLQDKKNLLSQYEQNFRRIREENEVVNLANESERKHLARLNQVQVILDQLPQTEKYERSRHQYQLLRGVLLWDLNENASEREWQLLKQLKQTALSLYQLEQKQAQLLRAEEYASERFSGYAQRIDELESRNLALADKIKQVQQLQQQQLQQQAEQILKQRLTHVGNLLARVQLAIARLQDKAAIEGNNQQ